MAPGPEVDHFANPTELFNLINWERWDEAAVRCVTAPQEAQTWISSRDEDGTVRWRYLPLHLACRKCPAAAGGGGSRIAAHDALIDALLSVYRDAAWMTDHAGLLPIQHARVAGASEAVVGLLQSAHPESSIDALDDRGGGVAMTAVEECSGISTRHVKCDSAAVRPTSEHAAARPKTIPAYVADSSPKIRAVAVASDPNSSTHELVASQMVIVRLEEELARCRSDAESAKLDGRNLFERLAKAEHRLGEANDEVELKSERMDALLEANDALRTELDRREREAASLREEMCTVRAASERTLAEFRSEAETARALSEALEEKLRSKFSSETMLSTRVRELEVTLEETTAASEAALASFKQQEESLRSENATLRDSVLRLTRNNSSLQDKVRDLTAAVVGMIQTLHSMSQEQERVVAAAALHEEEVRIAYEGEKAELLRCGARQRKLLEDSVKEQDTLLEGSRKRIDEACSKAARERREILDAIEAQKRDLDSFSCPSLELDQQGNDPLTEHGGA